MSDCDVILVSPIYEYPNIISKHIKELIPEDVYIYYLYMQQRHPEIFSAFEEYFVHSIKLHPYNMFICKKTLFDKFAQWQFGILEALRKLIHFTDYTRCNRVLGYFAENLLLFYMWYNNMNIKTRDVVSLIGGGGQNLPPNTLRSA